MQALCSFLLKISLMPKKIIGYNNFFMLDVTVLLYIYIYITYLKEKLVRNQSSRWHKIDGLGATKLTHVLANKLDRLSWHLNLNCSYQDYLQVPIDAGFVALITYLPKLKVLYFIFLTAIVISFGQGKCNNYFTRH